MLSRTMRVTCECIGVRIAPETNVTDATLCRRRVARFFIPDVERVSKTVVFNVLSKIHV